MIWLILSEKLFYAFENVFMFSPDLITTKCMFKEGEQDISSMVKIHNGSLEMELDPQVICIIGKIFQILSLKLNTLFKLQD